MINYGYHVARILLALPLTLFGLIGLVSIMPDPQAWWEKQEGFSPAATAFLLAMWDSGFLMHTVVVTHLVCGVLLLTNWYTPLALAVHLPVSIQMTLFHLFLDPGTGAIAYFVLLLNVSAMAWHRESYSRLLEAKASRPPSAS